MKIAAIVALSVLIAGTVAIVAVALVGGGSSRSATANTRTTSTRVTTASMPTSTTAPRHPCRTPLTAAAPLRLWVAGDSLAYSVGNGLGKPAAATGVVAPVYESRVSSGLASPAFFDWPKRAQEELPRLNPEVVVFVMGTNDWSLPQPASTGATGPAPWKARYTALVQTMVDLLTRDGRTLYWVAPPALRDDRLETGAKQIAEIIQSVVARNPSAEFVDLHAWTANADGSYSPTTMINDRKVTIRTGDGVHFTTDGATYVGAKLFAILDAQCRLGAQSVPNGKQVVVETKGSTSVAPNSTATAPPLSGSTTDATAGSTSGTPSTTASPATSPPPTTPPTTSPPATSPPPTTTPSHSPPSPPGRQ